MNCHMQSIDFVIALHQAKIKSDIYMMSLKFPRVFNIPRLQHPSDVFTNVYMLFKKIYGIKDYGSTWFDLIKEGLINRGWEQSTIHTSYSPNLV